VLPEVQLTVGILEHLQQALFRLQAFSAPKQSPCPPQDQEMVKREIEATGRAIGQGPSSQTNIIHPYGQMNKIPHREICGVFLI
jgi:hypothetical protein